MLRVDSQQFLGMLLTLRACPSASEGSAAEPGFLACGVGRCPS